MLPGIEACLGRCWIFLLMAIVLAGCANPFYKEGLASMAAGNREKGIAALEKAAQEEPRNAEIKASLIRNKGQTIDTYLSDAERLRAAGQLEAAEEAYRRVLTIEANNLRAMQAMEQIAVDRRNLAQLRQAEQMLNKGDVMGAERIVRTVRGQDPLNPLARRLQEQIDQKREKENSPASNPAVKAALAKPVALEFRDATLKSVFEVLSRSSGLNFVFDKDVKGDSKVTFFVRNSPLEDIIRLILTTNQLEKRLLNENSFLIYPNTPAKAKDYQELVVRSFYLANTDVKQAQNLIKTVAKSKDVFADEKLNLIIVKDTPDAIRLIERLIDSLDMAEPEVMLEVEVLEVSRSRLNELGVKWPDSVGYGLLQAPQTTTVLVNGVPQSISTTPGGTLAPGYINMNNAFPLTSFIANPALTLNIKGNNADTNLLANPRIRVKNREKAKIHIGEKLPVFTTTSTANVGVSASVSYLDVGLKLDVDCNVTLDDEVSIKVGLDVSNIVKEVPGPSGSLAYQLGTRSATTVLRLRNGETQVLAGLISDQERRSTAHLPGLGEMPILGRLFGTQRDENIKSEIILLITPRVLRNIHRPDFGQPALPSGTDASIGAAPLTVKTPAAKSLGMSSGGAGGRGAGAAASRAPVNQEVEAAAEAPVEQAVPAVAPANVQPAPAAGGEQSPAAPGTAAGNSRPDGVGPVLQTIEPGSAVPHVLKPN
jgi:general secretion pathway protein D